MIVPTVDAVTGVMNLLLLLFAAVQILRLPELGSRSAKGVFFLFAIVCLIFDEVYWLIYELLQVEKRMPIAANEICEAAAFLLLARELKTVFLNKASLYKKEMIASGLFATASIALWIAWSGEWLQDIGGGLCFGYLLCVCVMTLSEENILSRAGWLSTLTGCTLLIFLETGSTLFTGHTAHVFDLAGYAFMAVGEILFLKRTISLFRNQGGYRSLMAVSFSGFIWSASCYYMSSGIWYTFHFLIHIAYTLMMWAAVKKEVSEA